MPWPLQPGHLTVVLMLIPKCRCVSSCEKSWEAEPASSLARRSQRGGEAKDPNSVGPQRTCRGVQPADLEMLVFSALRIQSSELAPRD